MDIMTPALHGLVGCGGAFVKVPFSLSVTLRFFRQYTMSLLNPLLKLLMLF